MPEKKFGQYESWMVSITKPKILFKNMAADKISRKISLMIAEKPARNYLSTDKRVLISSGKNAKKNQSAAKDMYRVRFAFRMEKKVGKELA